MVIIEYHKDGSVYSDFNLHFFVDFIERLCKEDHDHVVKVAAEIMIDAVRESVAKGKIDHKLLMFRYDGTDIEINEYASLNNWPKGFCDTGLKFVENILTTAMAKRKLEKSSLKDGK